jgi:predicted nucleic acid-binding protein
VTTAIIDSNAIVQDFNLTSADWRVLLYQSEHGDRHVIIPEIAVRESVGKFRRELEEYVRDSKSLLKGVSRLPITIPLTPIDVESEVARYETQLRAKLSAAHVDVTPPTTVDALTLVNRAVARRRPFDDEGNGFRDTLIWLGVCDELKSRAIQTALISNDKLFRSTAKSFELHQDLKEDLTRQSTDPALATLFGTVKDFLLATGIEDAGLTAEVTALVTSERARIDSELANALEEARVEVPNQIGASWVEQGYEPLDLSVVNVAKQVGAPGLALVEIDAESDIELYAEPSSGPYSSFSTTTTVSYSAFATYDIAAKQLGTFTVPRLRPNFDHIDVSRSGSFTRNERSRSEQWDDDY